jgi:hypothetical protein
MSVSNKPGSGIIAPSYALTVRETFLKKYLTGHFELC